MLSLADKQGLGNVLARGTIIKTEHTTGWEGGYAEAKTD